MNYFDTKIEFLKGVGPKKSSALNIDLGIFTFGEMLQHYPFRHEDRTSFHQIRDIDDNMPAVQMVGIISYFEIVGEGRKSRLTATFRDETGEIDLIWFQSAKWVYNSLQKGAKYIVFGKPNYFNGGYSISHPELQLFTESETDDAKGALVPVYSTTEKLKKKFLNLERLL